MEARHPGTMLKFLVIILFAIIFFRVYREGPKLSHGLAELQDVNPPSCSAEL